MGLGGGTSVGFGTVTCHAGIRLGSSGMGVFSGVASHGGTGAAPSREAKEVSREAPAPSAFWYWVSILWDVPTSRPCAMKKIAAAPNNPTPAITPYFLRRGAVTAGPEGRPARSTFVRDPRMIDNHTLFLHRCTAIAARVGVALFIRGGDAAPLVRIRSTNRVPDLRPALA